MLTSLTQRKKMLASYRRRTKVCGYLRDEKKFAVIFSAKKMLALFTRRRKCCDHFLGEKNDCVIYTAEKLLYCEF